MNNTNYQLYPFIVDLEHYGESLYFTIKSIINPRQSRIETVSIIDRIYKELVMQAIKPMNGDFCDYSLSILSLPSFSYFSDIQELYDNSKQNILRTAFKEFALGLVIILRDKVGKGELHEYLLNEVTRKYIVVTRIVRGN